MDVPAGIALNAADFVLVLRDDDVLRIRLALGAVGLDFGPYLIHIIVEDELLHIASLTRIMLCAAPSTPAEGQQSKRISASKFYNASPWRPPVWLLEFAPCTTRTWSPRSAGERGCCSSSVAPTRRSPRSGASWPRHPNDPESLGDCRALPSASPRPAGGARRARTRHRGRPRRATSALFVRFRPARGGPGARGGGAARRGAPAQPG